MPEPRYKIGTAAKLTGLSPFLLRAWETRHELLSPSRSESGQRFYSEGDLEVLRAVKLFLDKGYTIGEVSGWERDQLLADAERDRRTASGARDAGPNGASHGAGSRDAGRGALFAAARERVLDGAVRLDQASVDSAVAEALAAAPFDAVLAGLMVPVLEEIGVRWTRGEMSVASEHFATASFKQRLLTMIQATARLNGPLAVVAGAPDDYHELGALVAVYHLARRGWSVLYLGPNLPVAELAAAVEKTKPGWVGLGVTLAVAPETLRSWLDAVRVAAPAGAQLVCGGSGAREHAEIVRAAGFALESDFALADRRGA